MHAAGLRVFSLGKRERVYCMQLVRFWGRAWVTLSLSLLAFIPPFNYVTTRLFKPKQQ
jgi:hypothetical protein